MEVDSLLGLQLVVALCGFLQGVQGGELGGFTGGFGLRLERLLLGLAPGFQAAEAQLDLLLVALDGEVDGTGAQRDQLRAVVVFPEAVLQTVFPVAVGAVHARVPHGVDQRLACGTAALLGGLEGRFPRRHRGEWGVGGRPSDAVAPSVPCPFAGVAAFVGCLAAVV